MMKIEHSSSHPTEILPDTSSPQKASTSAVQKDLHARRALTLTAPPPTTGNAPAYYRVHSVLVPAPANPEPTTDNAPAYRRVLASDVAEIVQALQGHLNEKARDTETHINRGWSFHGSERSHLKSYISANKKLTNHVNVLLEKYQKEPATGNIDPNTILSIEDVAKISRAFEAIAERLPKGETRELAGLLGLNLKAAWEQMKADELKAPLIKELEPYRNPETSKADTVSLGVNLEAGLPGIKIGRFKVKPLTLGIRQALGLSKKAELSVNPEGIVYLNNHTIKQSKTSVNVGMDIPLVSGAEFSGNVQIVKDDIKLDWFRTVDDLVENRGHAQRWGYANRNEYDGILKPNPLKSTRQQVMDAVRQRRFPTASELANLKADQQHATDNQARLTELLKSVLDLQHADISAPPPDRSLGMTGHSTTITASVGGTAKANLGAIVDGEIDLTYRRLAYDFHLYDDLSFTDVVLKDPERLKELPSRLMRHATDSLAHTEASTPERQQAAVAKLKELDVDLKYYYTVVKKLDALRYRESTGLARNPEEKLVLRREKHLIEEKWHAIGRHNLLQTLSASHAHLALNALPPGWVHSDEARQVVEDSAKTLATPDIRYSKHRLSNATKFKLDDIQQDHSNTVSARATISALGQEGTLSYTHETLSRIHANRMRQGDYVNKTWEVAGTLNPTAAVGAAEELAGRLGADVEIPNGLAEIVTGVAGDVTASHSRKRIVREYRPEYTTYPEFDGDKGYKTRFTRQTATTSYAARLGGEGPVAPGINLGGELGFEHSTTHMVSQTLGTDDLSYVLLMLNRKYGNRVLVPGAMDEFYETHKVEFAEIFKKLGNPDSSLSKEARYFLNELTERAAESEKDRAKSALDTLFDGAGRHGRRTLANDALNTLASQTSNWEQKGKAIDQLKEIINAIPFKRIKEPVSPHSVLSTLGVGKGWFNIEKPSSKLEKAERALDQLMRAHVLGSPSNSRGSKLDRQAQEAVKTLTKIFKRLDTESEYDKARKTLATLVDKSWQTTRQDQMVKTALTELANSNEPGLMDSSDLDTVRQNHRDTLARFIDNHAHAGSDKAQSLTFADRFNRTMAAYRADPSSDNLKTAKDVFFEFQQRQAAPSGDAKKAVWEDVTYAKWQADSAFNPGTRLLLNTGLHPRARNRPQPAEPTRDTRPPASGTDEGAPEDGNRSSRRQQSVRIHPDDLPQASRNGKAIDDEKTIRRRATHGEILQRPQTTIGDILNIPRESDSLMPDPQVPTGTERRNGRRGILSRLKHSLGLGKKPNAP